MSAAGSECNDGIPHWSNVSHHRSQKLQSLWGRLLLRSGVVVVADAISVAIALVSLVCGSITVGRTVAVSTAKAIAVAVAFVALVLGAVAVGRAVAITAGQTVSVSVVVSIVLVTLVSRAVAIQGSIAKTVLAVSKDEEKRIRQCLCPAL